MQSLQISRFGGPEAFRLLESPSVPVFPAGVRIQVSAAGVNFADLMMRMGMYPEAPPLPFVPGYEIAGTVSEVGSEVRTLQVGDRVMAGTKFGGYVNEIVLPAFQVRKIPQRLSETEAAAIPVAFITAWAALMDMARVRKGDRVLIQSAAGGVGLAAVQIASQAGAHVVGISGSPSKFDLVKGFGAAEMMTDEEWQSAKASEMAGFDIILNSAGGSSLKLAFKRLASCGRVVSFGASSMVGNRRSYLKAAKFILGTPFFHPLTLMNYNKGVYGLNVLKLFEQEDGQRMIQAFDHVLERFERGDFRVLIGKTFPLAEAGTAHNHLQSRANSGKIVLLTAPST